MIQTNTSVNLANLIDQLQNIGLISEKITPQTEQLEYFTGERFLEHIAYMGCSPNIQFEPDNNNDDKKFCHIKIHQYETKKLIVSNKQATAPHCPNCKKPVKNWREHLTNTMIHCQLCETDSAIEAYNWRKMAGYSQLFIEVTDIFPKEAIPQASLLAAISEATSNEWQYFYSCL